VFPDLAERAAAAIEVRLAADEYEGMDEAALADLLTSQLNDICADKHLRVRTMPPGPPGPARRAGRSASAAWPTRETPAGSSPRRWNWSRATYALTIDLRHSHGGSPEGVVFWCSYLLPGGGIHLNDIFHADTGETRQFWSLAPIDPEQSTQQMIAPCPASTSPCCS
jgi:hypothetical protein